MYVERTILRRRDDVANALASAGESARGGAEQFFTLAELDYCAGRLGSLGARLLIKDCVFQYMMATFKHGERQYREIEIAHDEWMRPTVRLFGKLEKRVRHSALKEIRVSISHSRSWIAGMVLFCY